jgi:WD40 repeat protein
MLPLSVSLSSHVIVDLLSIINGGMRMKRFIPIFFMILCLGQIIFTVTSAQAADFCQWKKNPDNIRAIYQPYNQRLIMMNSNRDVLQIVEENLITSAFRVVNYSPNCRYLAGSLATMGKRFDTVIWDLESQPVKRVGTFDNSYREPYRVDWSSDSNYAVISGGDWADLLRISDGNRVRLTHKIVADCSIHTSGCVGRLYAYFNLYWHPELNQVHMTLTDGNVAVIDLNNGQPIDFRNIQGEPLPSDKAVTLREQMASPYGCSPDVQYQVYNHRLVLKSITTGELVNIIQSDLLLSHYRFLGWSPNCNYVAAEVDEGKGIITAIWDTRTNSRVAELPYSPKNRYRFDWSTWVP